MTVGVALPRDQVLGELASRQMQAFLHVLREGESTNHDDSAYTLEFGGAHFVDMTRHPYDGIPTTQGGKACGAYGYLGTTWKSYRERYSLPDFSKASQDFAACADIGEHGAWPEVEAGDLAGAIAKLAKEWVSLPGLGARAERIFTAYGGALGSAQSEQIIPQPAAPATTAKAPMPVLALLPLIAQFIPQIMTLIKPNSVSTAKDAAVAGTILDTVVKAAGVLNPDGTPAPVNATTVGQAADKMAADPALAKQVQASVVTHPDIMPLLEVGGGVAAAREADLKQAASGQPFWKASAVFWVSVLLLPLVYWLVGSLIVGGIELPNEWPWYAQLPFKLLGTAWNGESRSGGFNLVIGLVLGGICGVYYGVSVTQQKQQAQASATSTDESHPA